MTLMPAHTDRLHLSPYWLGDSPRAIRKAGRHRRGHRDIDLNCQRCKDGVAIVHWGTAGKNGYFFIIDAHTGKRRHMTYREIHKPLSAWSVEEIKRWRRTLRRGTRYETWVRPLSYQEAVQLCIKHGARPCFELKSKTFDDVTVARSMVNYAKTMRKQVFFMTLVTMRNWRNKGRAIKAAGGHIALLAHGAPKPADLANFVPEVFDRVWGNWR